MVLLKPLSVTSIWTVMDSHACESIQLHLAKLYPLLSMLDFLKLILLLCRSCLPVPQGNANFGQSMSQLSPTGKAARLLLHIAQL